MDLLELIKAKPWFVRVITLSVMLILFQIALLFMHAAMHPIYLQLQDIGHNLIPNIRDTFGSAASYIWWLGSISEEIYAVILMTIIAITGKGCRWGVAFALVATVHSMLWHFTILPTPPDILWQFPFITGQVPRPDDFWFSGHTGNALLLILFTRQSAWWIQILAYIYFVFMIWLVLATRTHYSIDVLGGIFVTYTIYVMVQKYWRIV